MKMRIKEMCYGRSIVDGAVVVLVDDSGFQICCPATDLKTLMALLIPTEYRQLRDHLDLPCLVA